MLQREQSSGRTSGTLHQNYAEDLDLGRLSSRFASIVFQLCISVRPKGLFVASRIADQGDTMKAKTDFGTVRTVIDKA